MVAQADPGGGLDDWPRGVQGRQGECSLCWDEEGLEEGRPSDSAAVRQPTQCSINGCDLWVLLMRIDAEYTRTVEVCADFLHDAGHRRHGKLMLAVARSCRLSQIVLEQMKKLTNIPNLTELTYRSIKAQLLDGTLREGMRLTEELLATQLGISKSPVREALNRLEAEGLVCIEARRGAYVREFSPKEISDLYDLREVLEMHSIAAAKADAGVVAGDGGEHRADEDVSGGAGQVEACGGGSAVSRDDRRGIGESGVLSRL